MFNKERFEQLQPLLRQFDIGAAKLIEKYHLTMPSSQYFIIWEDYTLSEGNVKLDFKPNTQMPQGFIESVNELFESIFDWPARNN